MDLEPSSINEKNASRLTRRRVMKLATAAGFSTATALTMTPEDVKAQDSDQVTISFDISGRNKKTVDADWYDHVQRSKRVRDTIESKYYSRDGINGVGIGNDGEHHVVVVLDKNHSKKDERRGELPERKNDVRIEIEEEDEIPSPKHNTDDGCQSHEGPCDDKITDTYSVPGGVVAGPYLEEECTLGSRLFPGSCKVIGEGWSLPVHCLTTCYEVQEGDDRCSSDRSRPCEPVVQEDIFHNYIGIGQAICYDEALDFVYIEEDDSSVPESEIVLPSDHSNKVHIKDSVSDSGLDVVMDGYEVTARGVKSCEVDNGSVDFRDLTRSIKNYCREEVIEQVEVTFDNSHLANKDSGGVFWVTDNGDNFAVTHLSSSLCAPGFGHYGPQAHSIQDRNDVWWSDL